MNPATGELATAAGDGVTYALWVLLVAGVIGIALVRAAARRWLDRRVRPAWARLDAFLDGELAGAPEGGDARGSAPRPPAHPQQSD